MENINISEGGVERVNSLP